MSHSSVVARASRRSTRFLRMRCATPRTRRASRYCTPT
jgi:hypothetical protein